jgi:bifunctional DNA-binding transcriptional regulator/antitoxin component of YhaV-PrlF toxin-antitoxin module
LDMDALVTHKGQVTIPVKLRRKYKIVEGMKLTVEDSPSGIVFKIVPKIEDLAGVDAQTTTIEKAYEIIEKMRIQDRD